MLSRLAGCIGWSVRWASWDTASARFAWALGPSEAPRSESGGGLWDTGSATREGPRPTCLQGDAEKGPESRATKRARNAGGVNQREAIRQANWQTCREAERCDYQRDGCDPTKPRDTQLGQVKRGGNWQTCVAMDAEQSGSGARGPSQTSEVRAASWSTPTVADGTGGHASRSGARSHEDLLPGQVRKADWISPNARDWKDSGVTQGNRKSPNLGTQAIRASGLTPDGRPSTPKSSDG